MVLSTRQRAIMIACSAATIGLTFGACFGWTSPVIPKLRYQTEDSPLDMKITPSQEGTIGSLIAIGAATIPFFTVPLADTFGRKRVLLVFALCFPISYGLLIIANSIWFFYVARFIQGLAGGGCGDLIPMYIAEIAPDDIRGGLCSIATICLTSGIVYSYILGPQVNYITFQFCIIILPIPFFASFMFMPESPYFFALKGREEELNKSLVFLHGNNDVKVEEERSKIQSEVVDSFKNRGHRIDILKSKHYRRLMLITCGLMFFHHMTGTVAVTLNCQTILASAGSIFDPALATIVLGFIQLASNILTPFIIDRFGRKNILYISTLGMAVPLLLIGNFFHLKAENESLTSWLPTIALYTFNVFFGLGFGPVPWAMLGEMFPPNIRPTATAMTSTFSWFLAFIITRTFPVLHYLGEFYAFYIFGGCCCCALVFVKFCVVETKQLSLRMIQDKIQQRNQ